MALQVYQYGVLQYEFDSGNPHQDYLEAKEYIQGCDINWCIKYKCEETDEWSKSVLELYENSNFWKGGLK